MASVNLLQTNHDKAPALIKGLRVAAHHCHRNANSSLDAISPKALNVELAALVTALDTAKASLESLTDAQREMMRHGSAMFNSDLYISRIGQRADADGPSVQTRTVQLARQGVESELPLRDIGVTLDVLANAVHLGAVPLDPSKRGRRSVFPLAAWFSVSRRLVFRSNEGNTITTDVTIGAVLRRCL